MRILYCITNIVFCLFFVDGFSQKKAEVTPKKDSVIYKTGYGLRLGADISKLLLPIVDKSYSGLEVVADYRVSKNWYIATELGYENEITYEDYLQSTSSGSYIRLGTNYNAYSNWLDMNNEIYVGMRYGFAMFEQTLNSYTPNVNSTYFPAKKITTSVTSTGLNAHWVELQLGIKAETLKNLFIGFSGSYKIGISIQNPENFKTLYASGFNRVYESGTGFGFNYTISYLIPFVKK